VRAHDPQALRRVSTYAFTAAPEDLSLSDAQLVVARESGFSSWARLKARARAECLARPMMRLALVAAANRACETEVGRPLYRDPYARALAGEEGRALLRALFSVTGPGYGTGPNPYMSVKTKFFDDALQSVVNDSAIRQVVIMNAGLDTRSFRLAWPFDVDVFEVDRSEVFEHKEPVLTRLGARVSCRRHVVSADLMGQWTRALVRRGFDSSQPAAFFIDRIECFDAAVVNHLVDEVTALSKESSWIGFAVTTDEARRSSFLRPFLRKLEELDLPVWRFGLDEPEAWLAKRGWTATSVIAGAPEAHYGRWPLRYIPRETPAIARTFFTVGWKSRKGMV
jgi:methyltransferase (TIGR00027 family)